MEKLSKIKCKLETKEEKIKLKEESKNNSVNIDFSLFYFPSISLKYFNNYFKDENSYNKYMGDFYHKILNYLKNMTYTELESRTHSHHIEDNEQVRLINKILDEYLKKFPFLPDINIQMRQEFYQISSLSGSRIIGIRYGNIFYILFIDPYHLVYANNRYNDDRRAYKQNNSYHVTDDLKIFDASHLLEHEKCTTCEIMDKILK